MTALIINCSPVRNGATAEIARLAEDTLRESCDVQNVCIDDFTFGFCKGCRACHKTAVCVQHDGADKLIALFDRADIILCVSPSYWADIPGQFKAFIDRCTPWCNTHEPHAVLRGEKTGYVIALRTGPGEAECNKIIETVKHFYGHMEIQFGGGLPLCSVENKNDVLPHRDEIIGFCRNIK